jgi:hypothetical protein
VVCDSVNAILRILAAKGTNLLLCAPTGRAAKRMTEATGFEAKTIHRLLEVDPKSGGFKRGDDNPLDCDLLVVDETSMVDVMLMQALMSRVEMWRGGCRSHISVSASFVWRCLSGATVAPFPHPAHRTGHADLPHPALGQDLTPLLSRATPSAAFEHQSELIGCPISRSFAT